MLGVPETFKSELGKVREAAPNPSTPPGAVVVTGHVERLAKALYGAAVVRRKLTGPPWEQLEPTVEKAWLDYACEGLTALAGGCAEAAGRDELAWAALRGQVREANAAIRDFLDALRESEEGLPQWQNGNRKHS